MMRNNAEDFVVGARVRTFDPDLYYVAAGNYRGGYVEGVIEAVTEDGVIVAWEDKGDCGPLTCDHHRSELGGVVKLIAK